MRSALSAIFFLPLVAALSNLQVSTGATSGGQVTITWTQDASDPATVSFELVNTIFHNSFAIANNIETSLKTLTVTLPTVPPGDQYTLEAVQIDNINNVIGTSAPFSIGATATTSASSPVSSPSVSATGPAVSSANAAQSTRTSGTTLSSSSSSSSASPSNFNGNGALGGHIDSSNVGSIAAAVIGIIAGAVLV